MKKPTRLARRLKQLRTAAGMTQEALAEKTGLAVFQVAAFEQGKYHPSPLGLVALAKGLGVPMADLLATVEAKAERAIAKAVGVSHTTVQADLSPGRKLPSGHDSPATTTVHQKPAGNNLPSAPFERPAATPLDLLTSGVAMVQSWQDHISTLTTELSDIEGGFAPFSNTEVADAARGAIIDALERASKTQTEKLRGLDARMQAFGDGAGQPAADGRAR